MAKKSKRNEITITVTLFVSDNSTEFDQHFKKLNKYDIVYYSVSD